MTILQLLEQFRTKRVLVLGDVMIDAYIVGKVHRVSPEAPVPIVSLGSREERLGGAGNVALNLKSLGATPVLCTIIGNDSESATFYDLLKNSGLSAEGIIASPDRVTTIKTRVIGNNQQLLRIDSEDIHAISAAEEEHVIRKVGELLSTQLFDAIIFEDYNKGLLTETVIRKVIALAKEHKVFTAVDPKKDNFTAYEGVSLFKPNLKELREGVGIDAEYGKPEFGRAVDALQQKLKNDITLVTLSEHGVFICSEGEHYHVPAHLRNIADVSGAGDTVISVATLCLASGVSVRTIAEISNLAGGLVCEKSGVVTIEPDQLIEECEGKELD